MKIKPWRVNYVASYRNASSALRYRETVHAILKGIALLRNVECVIEASYSLHDENFFQEYPDLRGLSTDLVYFRSTPQTKESRKDFVALLDPLFRGYHFHKGFEVGYQLQNALKLYPFPEN